VLTTTEGVEQAASHASDLREAGVTIHALEDQALYPLSILELLASRGITRVLVEAGPELATSFIAASCVDHLYWYRAPVMLGNAGQAAIGALQPLTAKAQPPRLLETIPLGPDRCEIMEMPSVLPACLPD
jgi:riboflavin biosynthesis pyrimidine reductase